MQLNNQVISVTASVQFFYKKRNEQNNKKNTFFVSILEEEIK